MPSIRRLTEADAEAFRAMRLAALELAPDAFATPLEAEAAWPLSHFAAILREAAVFHGRPGTRSPVCPASQGGRIERIEPDVLLPN